MEDGWSAGGRDYDDKRVNIVVLKTCMRVWRALGYDDKRVTIVVLKWVTCFTL